MQIYIYITTLYPRHHMYFDTATLLQSLFNASSRHNSEQSSKTLAGQQGSYSVEALSRGLKVHKRENFLSSGIEICTFSLLVMQKC